MCERMFVYQPDVLDKAFANQRVGGKVYSYARYEFGNRSEDIKRIFCEHLDLLGVGWTRPNAMSIAIARRADVAALDRFLGPKR